jgi:hypothetical protein
MKITLDDGSTYEGDVDGFLPSGQGTCTYSDGTKYRGEWKDGLHHGQGIYTLPDGTLGRSSELTRLYSRTVTHEIRDGSNAWIF